MAHPILKTRIAPTPSGYLHIGNGVAFVLTWVLARASGGSVLLRIDDLDAERTRVEYLEDIFRTLDWLGIDYDEGPSGVEDFIKNYSQHNRLDLYNAALKRLVTEPVQMQSARVLYACTCSRKNIRALAPDGLYPLTCRPKQLPFNAPDTAWRVRLNTPHRVEFQDFNKNIWAYNADEKAGDFIIRQKNGLPAYQLASLIDDLHFNITHVVRGADLLPSTIAQLALSEYLHEPRFANIVFHHHPLLLDDNGEKLSKSKGAMALKTMRESGLPPSVVIEKVAAYFNLKKGQNLDDVMALIKQDLMNSGFYPLSYPHIS